VASSHRQILRATSIIGGSSLVNIVLGLVRMKAAALLLGPFGVGLVGLFQSLMSTAAVVASLGFGTAGTRQIAEAKARGPAALRTAELAFALGTLLLTVIAGVAIWLLRSKLALLVLDDARMAGPVGWLAIGVALSVIGGSQSAFLAGVRRIRDVALVTIVSAVVGSIAAIAALFALGVEGIAWFVIAMPVTTALVGAAFVLRVPRPGGGRSQPRDIAREWRLLVQLGAAFSVAGIAALGAQLGVRILIQRHLGTEALGLFQASWVIAMTYVGFVLQAMATDYYPRLSGIVADHPAARRIVNEQSEVALFLGGPILIAMIGGAPWIIHLLYSAAFVPAAGLLRWQIAGDVLKLASWPLAYVLLAAGRGRAFMLTEVAAAAVFVFCTWLLLPLLGIEAAGVGYFAMYLFYFPVMYILAQRTIAFRWSPRALRLFVALAGAASLTLIGCYEHPLLGLAVATLIVAAFVIAALFIMRDALPPRIAALIGKAIADA
jgi:O-antigen/teichoic acid export membrane protein